MPQYRVRYNSGYMGYWRYDIVDRAGAIVKCGITHPHRPDSVYAAEREAHRICDAMNASDAMMLAAMQAKAQVAR